MATPPRPSRTSRAAGQPVRRLGAAAPQVRVKSRRRLGPEEAPSWTRVAEPKRVTPVPEDRAPATQPPTLVTPTPLARMLPAHRFGDAGVVVSPAADGKQTINGPYNPPPEASRQPGVPQAKLEMFVWNTSKVFPGTSRNVDIFIPAQYVDGTVVPFMVIQDGDEQLQSFKTNIIMENLIAQHRLPVMAAIFVNRPDNGPERSLEYDCLDDDYAMFIANEILPEVKRRHPELNLTTDPNGRGSLGKSSGAPAAFTLGWRHPDLYRRILTMNGSFVNLCKNGPGANNYPAMVRMEDPKPLRLFMFSGSGDNGGFAAGNQALADALAAKGYTWRYVYGEGSTHDNHYGASLMTEALLWTWAGYPL